MRVVVPTPKAGPAATDETPARVSVSVIVPAHNEENVILRCLDRLISGSLPGELDITVVCNGCTDRTSAVVRETFPLVRCLELATPGKAAALNRGDEAALHFPRFYVDADVELDIDNLRVVADVLEGGAAECAAPRPEFEVAGRPWVVRSFYSIWRRLPYLEDNPVGSGVYALSSVGRARFGPFPDLVADDQFVMEHFGPDERVSVPETTFLIHTPMRIRSLIDVRTRVYRGNMELIGLGHAPAATTARRAGGLVPLCRTPRLLPAVAAYLGIGLIATRRARRAPRNQDWERDDSSRAPTSPRSGTAPVGYVVARYPALSHTFVMREVRSVRAAGVPVETFSVRRAGPEGLLTAEDVEEAARTWSIQPVGAARVLITHLGLLTRAPGGWTGGLLHALRRANPGLRSPVWQLFYFLEAGLLLAECRRRGIRHLHAHLANVAADVAWLATDLGCRMDGPGTWRWSLSMHGPTELANVDAFKLGAKVRSASLILCISDFARSQLMALVEPEHWGKLQVVHMGVDLRRYPGGPAATGGRVVPEILCVGRLDPVKGQAVLIEAVAMLVRTGHPLHLTVVGSGPAEAMLRSTVTELGLDDSVSLVGAKGQDELPGMYAASDIFCLASFAEGIPVVLMEAMASGVPVVSTTIAGIPELIHDGVNGLLVPPGRADLLSNALASLIDDRPTRRRLGAAGQESVRRSFDAEECGREVARQLIAPRSGPGRRPTTSQGRPEQQPQGERAIVP